MTKKVYFSPVTTAIKLAPNCMATQSYNLKSVQDYDGGGTLSGAREGGFSWDQSWGDGESEGDDF